MPYRYIGPYDVVNIEGKDVSRGEDFEATDVAYIEMLRTRGFHVIEKIGESSASAETTSSATPPAEADVAPTMIEAREPTPAPEEPPAEAPPA